MQFLPVRIQAPGAPPLTIRIQDDLHIEVPEGFSPKLLQQVIQALRSA